MTQPLQLSLKGLPLAPAEAIVEKNKLQFVDYSCAKVAFDGAVRDENMLVRFCHKYRDWIINSSSNLVTGLDKFTTMAYSQGTTESFDKFYLKYSTRKFKCFMGEYLYHTLCWNTYFPAQWDFIENSPLEKGDAVIVSFPFADTGNPHHAFNEDFLNQCYDLEIPVLIDAAFYGICGGMHFNFDHPAITDICFSLSKAFPVNLLRIGLRFTRKDDNDGLNIYQNSQYANRFGAAVGEQLISHFGPDDNFTNWRTTQIEFCKELGVTPSQSVIFGIDHNHKYDSYNRGMKNTNRLCFSKYFEAGKLPKELK